MDEQSAAKAEQESPPYAPCVRWGHERDEEGALKCAAIREAHALCVNCLATVVALRAAAQATGFHVGL